MNRTEFIRKLFRYLLFLLLAAIAAVAGSRSTLASDCSSCPGKGLCKDENDCSRYLSKK
jgi:hypothetical protein